MKLANFLADIIVDVNDIKDTASIKYPITIECEIPVAPNGGVPIDVRVVSGKDAENTPRIKLILTV